MSGDEETLYLIRGMIAGLSPEKRAVFESMSTRVRAILDEDVEVGYAVVALIGAELQAKANE